MQRWLELQAGRAEQARAFQVLDRHGGFHLRVSGPQNTGLADDPVSSPRPTPAPTPSHQEPKAS